MISRLIQSGRSPSQDARTLGSLPRSIRWPTIRLAYVSKTPGRTQHLNYFTLAEGKFFVDLPGYGFAKAPEEIRSQWDGLLAPYLSGREPLVGLVMIMDSRHPLTDLDVQMIDWFARTGKPIHVLLSKADKLTRQEQALVLREVSGRAGKAQRKLYRATVFQPQAHRCHGSGGGAGRLAGHGDSGGSRAAGRFAHGEGGAREEPQGDRPECTNGGESVAEIKSPRQRESRGQKVPYIDVRRPLREMKRETVCAICRVRVSWAERSSRTCSQESSFLARVPV